MVDKNLVVVNCLEDILVVIKIIEDLDNVQPFLLVGDKKQTNDLFHFNSFLKNFKNFQQ